MQLRADVFPVVITLTNSETEETLSFEKARVIVTLDHVYIFQDANPKPEIVFEDRLTSYTPPIAATRVRKASELNNRFAEFETEDGYTAKFQRMSSCGCGSRLKKARLDALFPEQLAQAASTGDSA